MKFERTLGRSNGPAGRSELEVGEMCRRNSGKCGLESSINENGIVSSISSDYTRAASFR